MSTIPGDLVTWSDTRGTLRDNMCALQLWTLGREEAPKHFFRRTVINSPHGQEFMVSRISSVVTTFLSPLLDEFTLMEVF